MVASVPDWLLIKLEPRGGGCLGPIVLMLAVFVGITILQPAILGILLWPLPLLLPLIIGSLLLVGVNSLFQNGRAGSALFALLWGPVLAVLVWLILWIGLALANQLWGAAAGIDKTGSNCPGVVAFLPGGDAMCGYGESDVWSSSGPGPQVFLWLGGPHLK